MLYQPISLIRYECFLVSVRLLCMSSWNQIRVEFFSAEINTIFFMNCSSGPSSLALNWNSLHLFLSYTFLLSFLNWPFNLSPGASFCTAMLIAEVEMKRDLHWALVRDFLFVQSQPKSSLLTNPHLMARRGEVYIFGWPHSGILTGDRPSPWLLFPLLPVI